MAKKCFVSPSEGKQVLSSPLPCVWVPCSASAPAPRLDLQATLSAFCPLPRAQCRPEARPGQRPGGRKRVGSLYQPFSSVLALIARSRAMVASRDLWTQIQGEEQDKIDQVNRKAPSPTHTQSQSTGHALEQGRGQTSQQKQEMSPSLLK